MGPPASTAPASARLLTLYSTDRDPSTYSFSPFATKLRFRLRHAGIPYDNALANPRDPPKKKIPYIRFAGERAFLGDTAIIISKLIEMGHMRDVNAGLSPEPAARDLCVRSLIEDRLYFQIVRTPHALAVGRY